MKKLPVNLLVGMLLLMPTAIWGQAKSGSPVAVQPQAHQGKPIAMSIIDSMTVYQLLQQAR